MDLTQTMPALLNHSERRVAKTYAAIRRIKLQRSHPAEFSAHQAPLLLG